MQAETMANKPKLNQQPNGFKGSIGVDTRQKHYEPIKRVDFNNKMKEYDPPNQYYNTKFNAERKKKDQAPKQQQPKPEPKAQQPKPQPKQAPTPKQQQPKPEPKPQPKPEPKQQPQQPSEIARPEPEQEQWSEPVHQQPIAPVAAAAPLAIPIGAGFAISLWPANRTPKPNDNSDKWRLHDYNGRRTNYYDRRNLPRHSHRCSCAHCRNTARYHHSLRDHYHYH